MNKIRDLSEWVNSKVKIEFDSGGQTETELLGVCEYGVFVPGPEYEAEFYPFRKINCILRGKKDGTRN